MMTQKYEQLQLNIEQEVKVSNEQRKQMRLKETQTLWEIEGEQIKVNRKQE